MRSATLVVAVLLVLAAPVLGDQPPTPLSVRVARLIEQLGSERFVEREAASRQLEDIGWVAREALNQALSDRDLERRSRAQRILRAIDTRSRQQTQALVNNNWWVVEPAVAAVQRMSNARREREQRYTRLIVEHQFLGGLQVQAVEIRVIQMGQLRELNLPPIQRRAVDVKGGQLRDVLQRRQPLLPAK